MPTRSAQSHQLRHHQGETHTVRDAGCTTASAIPWRQAGLRGTNRASIRVPVRARCCQRATAEPRPETAATSAVGRPAPRRADSGEESSVSATGNTAPTVLEAARAHLPRPVAPGQNGSPPVCPARSGAAAPPPGTSPPSAVPMTHACTMRRTNPWRPAVCFVRMPNGLRPLRLAGAAGKSCTR